MANNMIQMEALLAIMCSIYVHQARTSISGLTYRDEMPQRYRHTETNECDGLYWYPQPLPDYCNRIKTTTRIPFCDEKPNTIEPPVTCPPYVPPCVAQCPPPPPNPCPPSPSPQIPYPPLYPVIPPPPPPMQIMPPPQIISPPIQFPVEFMPPPVPVLPMPLPMPMPMAMSMPMPMPMPMSMFNIFMPSFPYQMPYPPFMPFPYMDTIFNPTEKPPIITTAAATTTASMTEATQVVTTAEGTPPFAAAKYQAMYRPADELNDHTIRIQIHIEEEMK